MEEKDFFFADFYCSEKKLVIEIDGGVHLKQMEYDQIRTEIMELKGLKVLRFKNEEVEENLDLVIKKIKEYLK